MKNVFYRSPGFDAAENLALDEHFLDIAKPGELVLYLYVNARAVIIGRNQDPRNECDLPAMARDGVKLVRRVSGGGAVYHDRGNLNFSFISGAGRSDEAAQNELLLAALREFGVDAEFTGRNDFCAGGRKFSGTAYINRGESRLRHGTLLIRSDLDDVRRYLTPPPQKLAAHGVQSVRGRVCNLEELCPALTVEAMAETLLTSFGADEIFSPSPSDAAEITRLLEKYRAENWTFGATPATVSDAL